LLALAEKDDEEQDDHEDSLGTQRERGRGSEGAREEMGGGGGVYTHMHAV
jgi:hypothetical protein